MAKKMNFPRDEIPSLRKRLSGGKSIFKTAIVFEQGRWDLGDVVETPLGRLVVIDVQTFELVEAHPFYDQLSDERRKEIGSHPVYDVIELVKES